jgi:hypothetical protein
MCTRYQATQRLLRPSVFICGQKDLTIENSLSKMARNFQPNNWNYNDISVKCLIDVFNRLVILPRRSGLYAIRSLA